MTIAISSEHARILEKDATGEELANAVVLAETQLASASGSFEDYDAMDDLIANIKSILKEKFEIDVETDVCRLCAAPLGAAQPLPPSGHFPKVWHGTHSGGWFYYCSEKCLQEREYAQ